MTAVFTDFFRARLFLAQTTMAGAHLRIVYFATAPSLYENDARVTTIQRVADLSGRLGWGAPLPESNEQVSGTMTVGNAVYVIVNNPFTNVAGWVTRPVAAAAIVYKGVLGGVTDPIIMITDSPFRDTVMTVADSLIAMPNTALSNNRAIFSWPVPPVGAPQILPVEENLLVYKAPPPFELSHMTHVWVYPQRVNLVANPSFEVGTNHWRTSGAASRVAVPAPNGGAWAGSFTGTAPVVIESNTFPFVIGSAVNDQWTIQAMVKGTGRLKVGLVGWEPTYDITACDWGDEEYWDLNSDSFVHVWAMRSSGENTTGMVRLEVDNGTLTVDNLLCEPDWLRDWPYFDGDTTYGARDDFSWYGGENFKGKSYSLWYNHRRAVIGRLFAWDIADNDFTVTDAEVEAQGFVYKWVPAGVRVTPHMDVLSQDDTQNALAIVDVAGQAINPYKTGDADVLGITNPWAADQYLTLGVATATTPDTVDMGINGKFRVSIRARIDAQPATGFPTLVSKQTGVSGREYMLFTNAAVGGKPMYSSVTDTTGAQTPSSPTIVNPTPLGETHTYGTEITPYSTAVVGIVDGVRTAGGFSLPVFPPDTAAAVIISQVMAGFTGRVYSAQMEAVSRAQLVLPGTNGNYLTVPDANNLDITGDVEIVTRVGANPWVGADYQAFFAKGAAYGLGVHPSASLIGIFYFTDAPSTPIFATFAHSFVNGTMYWIKMTRVASTGVVTFYWAADAPTEPTVWTTLGSNTPAGSAGKVISTNTQLAYVGALGPSSWPLKGRIARVIVRSTIGGAAVLDVNENNAGSMAAAATTFPANTGQTVTVAQTAGNTIVQPQADTTVWRFDATEYPGRGTTFTDPRGRVWTLSSATAIGR